MSYRQVQSSGRTGGRGGGYRYGKGQGKSKIGDRKVSKREMKFHPLGVKGGIHYGSFEEVKDSICCKLAKKKLDNPRDVIDCVINMEMLDLDAIEPQRVYSALQDEQARAEENDHLASKWSSEHKEWKYRKRDIAANSLNLHATIFEDCTEEMQEKLRREADFHTKLYRDPIELLCRIRKFMTTTDDADWEVFAVWEALRKLINTHQGKDESVPDYRRRFEASADALEEMMGDKILYQFTRATSGYAAQPDQDAKQNAALIVERHENVVVVADVKGKKKPGDSKSNTGGGSGGAGTTGDQHPGANFAQTGTSAGRSGNSRKCFVCGSPAHIAPECQHRFKNKEEWFNPTKYRNYSALQLGSETGTDSGSGTHGINALQIGDTEREIEQEEFSPRYWSMAQVGGQQNETEDSNLLLAQQVQDLTLGEDEMSQGSSVVQLGAPVPLENYNERRHKRARLFRDNHLSYKDKDILDTGSNFHMACSDHVIDPNSVELLPQPFEYQANTGQRGLTMGCYLQGEKRYLDRAAITNVRSLSKVVADGGRVTFDSSVENAFFVYPPGGGPVLRYSHTSDGLYARSLVDLGPQQDAGTGRDLDDAPNYSNNNNNLNGYSGVQTIKKNMEGFTKRQVEKANQARAGYHMAGAPDMDKFRLAIQGNFFKNCPITVDDVKNAKAIYGPSVSTRKGKRKRPTPPKVEDDWIAIPRELTIHNQKLEWCIDLMFVNNAIFLTGIDKTVRYRVAIPLAKRTKTVLYEAIDKALREYNHAGYQVKTIYCDGEFQPVFDPVKDEMDVHMNYCSPGEHEPTAERNNQTLKSLFRTHYHQMPFKIIPRKMTEALGERCAETANYYPAKGGISSHYSPHALIKQRAVDWNKIFVAETGAYVQGYGHETHRNQRSRTIDGIYLKPSINMQEGHMILDLNTRQVARRAKVEVFPITKQVINLVEEMARAEGVKDLRFYNKRGEVILDGDLLAGVDPDELWDEEFAIEEDEDQERIIDHNLRNDYISDEELQDLQDDYDEHYGSDSDNDGPTVQIFENIRRNRTNFDEEEQQSDDESDHDHHSSTNTDELHETLDALMDELQNYENYEDEIKRVLDEDIEDDSEEDTDDDMGMNPARESRHETTGQNARDESEDADDDEEASTSRDEVKLSPRKARSGHAYFQNGKKMRPSLRNKAERPKYNQPYLHRKKTKSNSNKNRSAMRKKERIKKLTVSLHQLLRLHKEARSKRLLQEDEDNHGPIDESSYNLAFQQIGSQNKPEYHSDEAQLIARMMGEIKDRVDKDGMSFVQQYYLNKGIKVFQDDGKKAAISELDQLVQRNCWAPVHVEDLSQEEKRKSVDAMMLLAQKNSGKIKGRCVYKGNETRDWLTREDTASPTASLEAILLTSAVDAFEERDVMSADIPNAFIQTCMPEPEEGKARVIMKITGLLVDYMVEIDPTYRDYIVFDRGKQVIYVVILRDIYGMLEASLLFYKKLRGDLEKHGFKFNPYDPCVCNKIVNGKQQTVRCHVDDLMSSHVDPQVNDDFRDWLNKTYGRIKEVTAVRGKLHEYLGMTIDYSRKGRVKIRMDDYVDRMLESFPIKFDKDVKQETPAANTLLDVGKGRLLDEERKEVFHSFVAKNLFLSKRARLDILPTVSVLASRVQKPNDSDWKKLVRLMRYIPSTRGWHLTLSAESLRIIKWYVDASFAVHPDFKSHTGAYMSMGKGGMQVLSRKQKLNTRSSTEAELVGVDDVMTMILWTKLFMEEQRYPIINNILYQDNKSAILLEINGRRSAGKRSRALNIRYYFVTDQVEKGNLIIEHCPTDTMIADFFTKPLQGEKFRQFRQEILGDQD